MESQTSEKGCPPCLECRGSGYQAMGCNLFACPECGGKGFENKDSDKLSRAADAHGEREGKTLPGA